ncbi:MAG: sulfite exporter TauE/SafE family protein [Gammaproteobacteria bacterium]|nr:sulfite exporter TauE/SafE family protein [Gammaproteobacteria bacterium]
MLALPSLILAVVLATSVLSGIVGMAGGMILMAVLVAVYSVPVAMILHGVTQAGANGSRTWFLRHHVRWAVLGPYLAGSLLCVGIFALFRFVPDRSLVLILIGAMPWLALLLPRHWSFEVERPPTAFGCGLSVTAAQLMAGASGPLLDLFFQRSRLDRRGIVATKAVTQTLGHLVKLGYYSSLLLLAGEPVFARGEAPVWLFLLVVPVAIVGTLVGTRVLERLNESLFRRISAQVILALGAACVVAGLAELLRG